MRARILPLFVVLLALAGCTAAAPTPTPTGFATEAEAFAAAEATYRAYVDALNAVDLADPATFEPVFALTTGAANASSRESLSQMHADRWMVSGESQVTRLEGLSATGNRATIVACLDVSGVALVGPDGTSRVSADRPDVQRLRIEVVPPSSGRPISMIDQLDGLDGDALTCA